MTDYVVSRRPPKGSTIGVPLGTVSAPTIYHAQQLAEALWGTDGIAAWHVVSAPHYYDRAARREQTADQQDVEACTALSWDRWTRDHTKPY